MRILALAVLLMAVATACAPSLTFDPADAPEWQARCAEPITVHNHLKVINACSALVSRQEDAEAAYRLGKLYYYGFTVQESDTPLPYKALSAMPKDGAYQKLKNGSYIMDAERKRIYYKHVSFAEWLLLKAAKKGHAKAIGELANINLRYYSHFGKDGYASNALKLAKEGTEHQDARAQYVLGMLKAYDIEAGTISQSAKSLFEASARKGLSAAQYQLGLILLQEKKDGEALTQFQKAAKQGNCVAMLPLGRMQEKQGAYANALTHYRSAASRSCTFEDFTMEMFAKEKPFSYTNLSVGVHARAEASYRAGKMLQRTDPSAREKAKKSFEEAAYSESPFGNSTTNLGHTGALLELANMADDPERKLSYLKQAANHDTFKQLRGNLNVIYRGRYDEAEEYYLPEHAQAHYRIGVMYQKGDGVTKSDVLAEEWFKKAADYGYKR